MLSLYIYAIYSSFKSSVCVSAPDPTQHLKMRWLERFWRRTAIIFGSPTSEPGIINRYFSQSTFVTLCRICCATCVTAECCATCVAAECCATCDTAECVTAERVTAECCATCVAAECVTAECVTAECCATCVAGECVTAECVIAECCATCVAGECATAECVTAECCATCVAAECVTAECVTAECCATCVTAVPPVLLQSEGHKKVLALQDIKRLNAAIHLARYVAVALCGSKQQLRDLGSCTCQGCNLKEVGNMV